MSAGRYRMALEAILVTSQLDAYAIARRALELDTTTPPVEADNPKLVAMLTPPAAIPATSGEPIDDEPEPIDLAAIDAELDVEEQQAEQPGGVGEGAGGGSPTAVGQAAEPSALPPARGTAGAPPRAERAKRGPTGVNATTDTVRAALRDAGEATTAQLAAKTGLHPTAVRDHLKILEDRGSAVVTRVQRRPEGQPGRGSKMYALVEQADAKVARLGTRGTGHHTVTRGDSEADRRTEVLACIREGAGIDEPEIALQLGMDREHVAIATGDLLADHKIVLRPDGTYVDATEVAA